MRILYLLLVVLLGISLFTSANGQRMTRDLSYCLERGGTCRYNECYDGEVQIGTCYHHTMLCCQE